MLHSLRVKNLALIRETEVEFGEGLNILTGETGAGKSLLIGSVNLALGGKFEKDMLRRGEENGLVELVFDCEEERLAEKLKSMDLEPSEDGTVILSRKLSSGKSICRINGETVTAKQVKELSELLIDIHGQHEHQSLLNKKKHMEILDAYAGAEFAECAGRVAALYHECTALEKKITEETLDDTSRSREQSLAEFEQEEIADASLQPGEDEELEQAYRKMSNSRKIAESLAESYQLSGNDAEDGAGNSLSRALRALRSVTMYGPALEQMEEQLAEVENLLSDYNHDVSEYMSDLEFDEEDFRSTEDRLNTINHLKGKYGNTIEEILRYKEEKEAYLEKLVDYDAYMQKLNAEWEEKQALLKKACEELSEIRRKNAAVLTQKLKDALIGLNFLTVEFDIAVRPGQAITTKGYDDVEFLISTNPGESLKPLNQVASGGELSRVMLAIKTVLAGKDAIDTLIFDEIDTGISGRTAWKVAEQLSILAGAHQVICITHLPQIAAMADVHFIIEKSSTDDMTITDIHKVAEEESLAELARLLGSDALTEAALSNAKEMKEQANGFKEAR